MFMLMNLIDVFTDKKYFKDGKALIQRICINRYAFKIVFVIRVIVRLRP